MAIAAIAATPLRLLLKGYIRGFPVLRGKHWLMERFGSLLIPSGPLVSSLPGGAEMELDLSEHVQRWIYYFGCYEPRAVGWVRSFLKPGMTVIDIGANVGQYTLLAGKAVGPTGRVHAFEPHPVNAERVRANCARNSLNWISVHQEAVTDNPGILNLFESPNDNSGEHSLFQFDENSKAVGVKGVTLDAELPNLDLGSTSKIDLIKIDVQGAEEMALRGAHETLLKHQPVIVCEFEERWLQGMGSSTVKLKSYLIELGYAGYSIGEHNLVSTPADRTHSFENLVMVADGSRFEAITGMRW